MNSQEFIKNICRICLDENVVLDWNTTLNGYYDVTYKHCFYKYTQLECLALETFSTMLCQLCLNGLYNTHTLILRAMESQKFFQTCPSKLKFDLSTNSKDNIKCTPTTFETVLVEKIEIEPIIQDHFNYEHSDEEVITNPVKDNVEKTLKRDTIATTTIRKAEKRKAKSITEEKKTEECNTYSIAKPDGNVSCKKSQRKTTGVIKKQKVRRRGKRWDNGSENLLQESKSAEPDEPLSDVIKDFSVPVEPKVKKKYKEIKKPRMCSICSKILHNKYAVQMHEKTHVENRERKETCKICGLKFYDKRNLYSHKRIHKENREKIHKCEFCNKAFYDKSGLNIHRRIHLGQMIPCMLCSKQYFRQIDLDRHMSSHSATTINSDTKKRSRYFVRCKHCDKSILSTSFKSHTAAHLNEPLMKCSICSKEFFRRASCVRHVKKVHQKTNAEYNDFIIQYKKNRISHLFLEQKADIQFADDIV